MITYWLDFPPVYDDELNFLFLHILKYTPVVFLPSALSILLWFKIVKNRKVDISLDIEVNKSIVLLCLLSTIFLVLIVYDIVRLVLAHRLLSFRQIYGDEVNYFSRLGKTDRKRWLVQEMYMRGTFGVK